MIDKEIVTKIRLSTCAVVRMPVPHEEALAGTMPGDTAPPFESHVIGTGFLVRPHLVLTNRHVIEPMAADHARFGDLRHWYLRFSYPNLAGGLEETIQRVTNAFALIDPDGAGRYDAGILEFQRNDNAAFASCGPVEFGELSSIQVGSDIGVCGFPLGNALLSVPGGARFGPVVHHGMISGVAPFQTDDPRKLTALLYDLNSAGGMSGSPVFTPEHGKVIGLHFAGREGTVGIGLPLDRARVDSWVRLYERIFVRN